MEIAGYILSGLVFVCYIQTVRAIWQLVDEARQLGTGTRFNRFWWMPAWKVHRKGYPESTTRRQVIMRCLLTAALMVVVMIYIVMDEYASGKFGR
jgi:hypothetical protein